MTPDLQLDTRSKLLKAAVTVFGKNGFEASSVRQIADLAGVNHGSIKYHYSSKGDLWRASVSYLFSQMEQAVHTNEAAWSKMTSRERLKDSIRSFVRYHAAHPELNRILTIEAIAGGERHQWVTDNYTRPFADRAVAGIALAQEDGIYPKELPAMNLHYMHVASGRIIFLMAQEIQSIFGVDVFAAEEVERHIDTILTLFMGASDLKPGSAKERSGERLEN
ncbi:TetR/AcrR family transcriptional regulator [Erythrobacter ani]|uniref:TetR/AcrR family transcriptional regulator n=1 Tax=Erythrobacter ani TaxID=2827235 RepID=A0ABS6SR48_9SPHN|nr:TetR/AcrR family transcriptional regulator [Erythrobacter ani]MBV7267529.1 TetR/AcrR family transcriptional regulator [Erythrobacter ani]